MERIMSKTTITVTIPEEKNAVSFYYVEMESKNFDDAILQIADCKTLADLEKIQETGLIKIK
jgi:hypothetical protein